jgi:hypothetical protein
MTDVAAKTLTASGGCLCGAVRYEISGPLRNIINCHCSKCRRFHGHLGAYTSVRREHLELVRQDGLKWFRSVTDETPNVHRGFCAECGASLFWDPRGSGTNIAVAAGSLDEPTGLKTLGHIWVSQKADYWEITDGLPQFAQSHDGRLS